MQLNRIEKCKCSEERTVLTLNTFIHRSFNLRENFDIKNAIN